MPAEIAPPAQQCPQSNPHRSKYRIDTQYIIPIFLLLNAWCCWDGRVWDMLRNALRWATYGRCRFTSEVPDSLCAICYYAPCSQLYSWQVIGSSG